MYDMLIIEQDKFANTLSNILKSGSYKVYETNSIDDSIEEIKKVRYNLIFVDIDLVNKNPLFWQMRDKYANDSLVVITSDKDGIEDRLFPIKENVCDIITKPYNMDMVLNLLNSLKEKYRFHIAKESIFSFIKSKISINIPSDKKYIEYLSSYLDNIFYVNLVSDVASFKIAFEEAVINAIIHGNKSDSKKNVKIDIHISHKKIKIVIEDEGQGFDYVNALIKLTETQTNIFKTSGRGIFMMSLYTDDFCYEKDGRKITLVKHL